ncbi:hypothetical protein PUNSTDRAFT_139106 [Punctularia strigosozonata HHB-11173 SS5]|uniref:DUF6532 domain-containing protein n=1 Tax=Punctularia strigosozonata (strain HHB-11173) TaxID=741275 RepID=R7S1S3_PUNST|nr:uncharacterized protein PUNSTDRAFT_139106 [Punctularia strigosozonata HHB-11173 SS5]EIN03799.1 hypothetical protein PUNSTDRAFT_139106 [Punctularia strigosozonata HHB-11173 SS5]
MGGSASSSSAPVPVKSKTKISARQHREDRSDDEENPFRSSKVNGDIDLTEDDGDLEETQQKGTYWKYTSIEDIHRQDNEEEGDSDNADERKYEEEEVEEAEPASKRQRANTKLPRIINSTPKPVAKDLPRRKNGNATHSRRSSTQSSRYSTPPPERTPQQSDKISKQYSPYNPLRAIGCLQGKQSPPSKSISKIASAHFRVTLATQQAFPNGIDTIAFAKASFLEACKELGAEARRMRFEEVDLYSKTMITIVKRGTSQLRGELKSKAQLLVETNYGFLNIPAENIKEGIQDLLTLSAFLFEDPFEWKGAFRNPIILTLLVQQWFQDRKAEAAGIFSAQFNPIPDKLIALIATAVECALVDWESGTNSPDVNDLTSDKYSPVYAVPPLK